MIYREKVTVNKKLFEQIKGLLEIEDINHLTEEQKKLNPLRDDCIGFIEVTFKNGNTITMDYYSGSTNYYDNCGMYDKNGRELTWFDISNELNKVEEFYYGEDIYIIEFEFD